MTEAREEKAGDLRLYTYWRSTAAYRVRIALNLKKLRHELIPVHLTRNGGEQHRDDYLALNPQGLVPTLLDGERILRQSLAILEYLDEVYPEPPLLPATPRDRARVRAIANVITCDIHPLNNLRVLQFLEKEMGLGDNSRKNWYHYWLDQGFSALETLLADHPSTGIFCEGDEPTYADICLVPQVYNARRFNFDLDPYPTVTRIEEACLSLPPFADAAPENQPDAT
jgi:maleylacetoacetate isomerase